MPADHEAPLAAQDHFCRPPTSAGGSAKPVLKAMPWRFEIREFTRHPHARADPAMLHVCAGAETASAILFRGFQFVEKVRACVLSSRLGGPSEENSETSFFSRLGRLAPH
jgi:hypothetical protein